MNPVRTLGPAMVTGNYDRIWIYIAAPILGAIFGTSAYDYMKLA
jgi:aquaporin NIP